MSELFEKAKVHIDRSQIDDAADCLTRYLNEEFFDPDALMMLGNCHLVKGNVGLSAVLSRFATQLKPKFPEALRNLGSAFKVMHKNSDAERIWLRALEQETDEGQKGRVLGCLGTLFINEGCPEKALAYLDRALPLVKGDDIHHIKWNRALALLELGRWQEGWQHYEYRFPCGSIRPRNYGNLKAWDGTPGKRVIVWGEQGIGDEILFASVLSDAVKDCAKVILDCHPRLVSLFKRSFPGLEIHGTRKLLSFIPWATEGVADCHVALSSLPVLYRRTDDEFPGKPYLKADPLEVTKLRGSPIRPRVGISWIGGTHNTRLQERTIPLKQWAPILNAIDADFYSLQYTEKAAREVCELEEATGIHIKHFPGLVECQDYDKTASFVASLDLVLTIPTSVYHLAGGLGVPTWCLTPRKPAWAFAAGARCWYGATTRFFRQKGDTWSSVVDEIADELRQSKFKAAA